MIAASRLVSVAQRTVNNYARKRPFCVSFEITRSCNARCKHCHLRGRIPEDLASPERFGQIARELNPIVVQISGGEPLMRPDLPDIVRAVRRPDRAPYVDITTNGTLLTKEKYHELRALGIDQFGISLDYPDERHDDFRGVAGLFRRIESLIESLEGEKKAITLLCVVQKDNFRDLVGMVELAHRWSVNINFSTYTWLRTSNKDYVLSRADIHDLKPIAERALELGRSYRNLYTSSHVFKKMIEFFENESIPRCRAGSRFMVVNPDGTLSPCGLMIKSYDSMAELERDSDCWGDCSACYTSIRANTEKPFDQMVWDSARVVTWS